jgi:hypothetical protein
VAADEFGESMPVILNDDTGAFDDLRRLIGLGGYRKFRNLFWKTFIAGIATMFTSGRGNYITGSTTNLGADGVGLTALELKFRQMKSSTDDGAKRITGRPSILLHPLDFVSGDADYLVVVSVGDMAEYNDFAHFRWLGTAWSRTPIFDPTYVGKWYCIEAHARLNDPRRANGVFELWINGGLEARVDGLNWQGAYSEYGINTVFLENYWNDGAPQPQERYFDNFVVSTQPIGC